MISTLDKLYTISCIAQSFLSLQEYLPKVVNDVI